MLDFFTEHYIVGPLLLSIALLYAVALFGVLLDTARAWVKDWHGYRERLARTKTDTEYRAKLIESLTGQITTVDRRLMMDGLTEAATGRLLDERIRLHTLVDRVMAHDPLVPALMTVSVDIPPDAAEAIRAAMLRQPGILETMDRGPDTAPIRRLAFGARELRSQTSVDPRSVSDHNQAEMAEALAPLFPTPVQPVAEGTPDVPTGDQHQPRRRSIRFASKAG